MLLEKDISVKMISLVFETEINDGEKFVIFHINSMTLKKHLYNLISQPKPRNYYQFAFKT